MITTNLKENMLTAYQTSITKIQLNDALDVTVFDTAVEESELIVQLTVPPEVNAIHKIALYQEDKLLSQRQLYVPISNDTIFKYKVEVNDNE